MSNEERENELYERIFDLEDLNIGLETERDIYKSTILEMKADIKYMLERVEGFDYIRNKYTRKIGSDKE